jgi:hypothetical protein
MQIRRWSTLVLRAKLWRYVPILALISIALTSLPTTASAQTDCKIEVDPGDNPLNIVARIGEENTFVDNLRLTAPCEGGVDRFHFLPSDLKREEGDTEIGRQNVTLSGDTTLEANVPTDFQVKVSGVSVPGKHTGEIRLLLPGQPLSEAQIIDLVVVAKVQPMLTAMPGTDQVQLRLTNCSNGLECVFGFVLGESAFQDETSLRFNNPAQSPVTVTAARADVVEEETRYRLTDEQLSLPAGNHTFPAQQIGEIPLRISREAIPAGHYTGAVYLTVDDATEQLRVPVDLSVRVGPWWPFLLLFLGIILGRLAKYMQERGEPLAKALDSLDRLVIRIQEEAPDDAGILLPQVRSARGAAPRGESLEDVQANIRKIAARLDALKELRRLQKELEDKYQRTEVEHLLRRIDQTRQYYAAEQDDRAKRNLDSLYEDIDKLDQKKPEVNEALVATIHAAQRAADGTKPAWQRDTEREATREEIQQQPKKRDLRATLLYLWDQFRAVATQWVVRPLLYVVLLLILLAIGLDSLYVNKGATFGAHPFADYLSLILWGLGSDVAGRTLANPRGSVQT